MKKFQFLTMLLIAATLTFTACAPGTYEIGDIGPSGVGIVFYVSDGGLHGLEAAPEDQSAGAAWSNVTNTQLGTTLTAIGSGSANTEYIINQGGHTASAAQICNDYRENEEGDWFLPSKDELNLLYLNKAVVDGLDNGGYWSSSEADAANAWQQDFFNGIQGESNKGLDFRVRAVRAF